MKKEEDLDVTAPGVGKTYRGFNVKLIMDDDLLWFPSDNNKAKGPKDRIYVWKDLGVNIWFPVQNKVFTVRLSKCIGQFIKP
jgi:hypothetical protein